MKVIKVYKDQNGTVFFEHDGFCRDDVTEGEAKEALAEAERMLEAGDYEEATFDPERCSQWYDSNDKFIAGPIHVSDAHAGLQLGEFWYVRKGKEAETCQKAIKRIYKKALGGDPFAK